MLINISSMPLVQVSSLFHLLVMTPALLSFSAFNLFQTATKLLLLPKPNHTCEPQTPSCESGVAHKHSASFTSDHYPASDYVCRHIIIGQNNLVLHKHDF